LGFVFKAATFLICPTEGINTTITSKKKPSSEVFIFLAFGVDIFKNWGVLTH